MPKVPSTSTNGAPQGGPLRRNEACHQCRKRKLVCDAKRPCSTCVRSHRHAISHSPPGTQHPPEPNCTFDEPLELTVGVEGPRSKSEKLENRIAELEALLREKDNYAEKHSPQNGSPASSNHDKDSGFDSESESSSTPTLFQPVGAVVSRNKWSTDLPEPDLLRHLVDAFFTFSPHGRQLFHFPTFMTSLSLPPNHPKFPAIPVLHAICAVGSAYTSVVTPPPPIDFDKTPSSEIFTQRYRLKENRPDSFAEQQAALAKITLQQMEVLGSELLQVLQTTIILSWYYCSHGSWAELFLNTAHSMRLSVPLGLNVCPPFHTISRTMRPASVLSPAKNVIEDELRRNVFWLAYAVERQQGFSNGWAQGLDDCDISQLLPVQNDHFEDGKLVSPGERQWAHSSDLLTAHPGNQIDAFILYVKATILLSKVKTFNLRFRAKHFSGDGEGNLSYSTFQSDEPVDPRNTMAFIELDGLTTSFLATFPPHLRNPWNRETIDRTLFPAIAMAHVAQISLHEPHADVKARGCISALKILSATRSIIDLIYLTWSTSFDMSLFEPFISFCFFTGGRVLVRFLQAAIQEQAEDQIKTFCSEIQIIKTAIGQMATRHRMGSYLLKMLEELSSIAEVGRWTESQALIAASTTLPLELPMF
ncbi:hypothetical protein BT96DRAFT_846815 [Gymnopus androsaceus JB14]|uniref:Zn(2)-C6 fungal-type domain-containing protein n=1 Tax=Gymnopus androsaceus JB14 TaxID=1447944 RepID=A0A6A4IQG2_9AGAR|nr:hypothetical protein BT96DRAFT_846815 [Gymnopus androsaceus JB14]